MRWPRISLTWGDSKRSESTSIENPEVGITLDNLHQHFGGGSNVTHAKALGYAPLFQAIAMISGDCAKLPFNVYERTDRGRRVSVGHSAQQVIHRLALTNPDTNGFRFWRRFYVSVLGWGNGYALIDRANDGTIKGLYQLLPDRTWIERVNGKTVCVHQTAAGTRTFKYSDVIHVEGLSINGLDGLNVVRQFREDFTIALAAKQFTVGFFKSNLSVGGILQVKRGTPDKKRRSMQKKIQEKFSGSENSFKTLVLDDNFQWFATQVDPQKAQLNVITEDCARQVARMYGIPPSKLALPDSTSYNSEEQATKNYYDGALSHLLISASAECTTKLLTEDERRRGMYCEHNVNALLWADALTRSVIANSGIASGRFSPNETRGWENLDGYDGGDQYFMPLNLAPVAVVGNARSGHLDRESLELLARQAFQRAASRACNKLERSKSIASDRQGILEIVNTTMQPIGAMLGRDCTPLTNAWFDSLTAEDSPSLRAQAVASYESIVRQLFSSENPSASN